MDPKTTSSEDRVGTTVRLGVRLLSLLVATTFGVELAIMLTFHRVFLSLPTLAGGLLDSTFLVVALFPALFYAVLRPLSSQIEDLERAEQQLSDHRDNLDSVVRKQLRELEEQNARLSESLLAWERLSAAHRETEARYRTVIEASQDAIIIADKRGHILEWNRSAAALFGYSDADVIGRSVLILTSKRDRESNMRRLSNATNSGATPAPKRIVELQAIRSDGTEFPVELSISGWRSGDSWYYSGVIRDITLRVTQDNARARLAAAIEQTAEYVIITDTSGHIQYVNPAFERGTGFSREEVLGEKTNIQRSGCHSETFYRELWGTLRRGEVWQGRFKNKRKDGTLYEEEATIAPVRDSTGTVVNYVAIKRDATEQNRLEAQARQAQKMEAIGVLAGGIAHDFNNILSAVLGYSEMVLAKLPEHMEVRTDVQEIVKAGQRARDLVRQILTFSRQSESEAQSIHLELIVKETLKLLTATLPPSIEIKTSISPDCGPVLADYTQMHQVLMNLCTNAYHAMREEGGVLEVALVPLQVDAEFTASHLELQPGPYVRLSVSDTGRGMEAPVRERIFEPFFTTKEKEEGTGLGLSTVHGIVKKLHGAILVYSEPNRGTVFHVFLPQVSKDEGPAVPAPTAAPLGNGEQILLVDDETMLVEVSRAALERLDYQVSVRYSAMDAFEAFRAQPSRFDLVLTDYAMPQMNGLELARQIKAVRPDIPIVMTTGFGEGLRDRTRLTGVTAMVHKPILIEELATAIHCALSESAPQAAE